MAAEVLTVAGRPVEAASLANSALARPLHAAASARLRCALSSALWMSGQPSAALIEAMRVLSEPHPPAAVRADIKIALLQGLAGLRDDRGPAALAQSILAGPARRAAMWSSRPSCSRPSSCGTGAPWLTGSTWPSRRSASPPTTGRTRATSSHSCSWRPGWSTFGDSSRRAACYAPPPIAPTCSGCAGGRPARPRSARACRWSTAGSMTPARKLRPAWHGQRARQSAPRLGSTGRSRHRGAAPRRPLRRRTSHARPARTAAPVRDRLHRDMGHDRGGPDRGGQRRPEDGAGPAGERVHRA